MIMIPLQGVQAPLRALPDEAVGAAARRRPLLRLVLLLHGRHAQRRGRPRPGDHHARRVIRPQVLRVPQGIFKYKDDLKGGHQVVWK